MARKKKKEKPEYGFVVVNKLIHGTIFPVKVYDAQVTPDDRVTRPALSVSSFEADLVAADLSYILEEGL